MHLMLEAENVLRADFGSIETAHARDILRRLLAFVCICGLAYGTIMGSFGGFAGDRIWQILFSATKVPLLLLGTFLICLPSFFVLNTVFGVRADFPEAVRALLAGQATMTIVLCSFAPFTVCWYLSSANYNAAVLFNAVVFGAGSLATQWVLRRLYGPLVRRNVKHRFLLRVWLLLYVFVGIQLGWALRPFVGHPTAAVQFVRPQMWGNAYVELLHHLLNLLPK